METEAQRGVLASDPTMGRGRKERDVSSVKSIFFERQ